MTRKIYLTILKTGIGLSFLSVFLVSGKLLFPFITSKQIYFNILIEILFVFWLAFIIKFPEYRPKKSWISIGLFGYFAVILISCFFGVDFNLSFWGDVERMLGFFHILHFLIFYFIVITAFREWRDWRNLMMVSLAAAVGVALYSFKITYSTIGNAAYVGGYLIFNVYFALILFFKTKNIFLRAAYAVSIFIMLVSLKNTGVAGAYVGLGASVFFLLFLYGALIKNKKVKAVILSTFIVLGILVSAVFVGRDSALVQNNNFLSKLTREISLGKNTFQTRLISWRAAWIDFPNHPVLGTGYGNYAITFDKYFDPAFYNYTRSETYFDRAHNNLVDIASTTGAAGLLSYLLIFAAVAHYLISGYRKSGISLIDFSLLSGLMAAYFIQNLAVFDSLATYMSLMAALGFIYWLSGKREEDVRSRDGNNFNNKEIYALSAGLIILAIIYQYNIKPLKMLAGTIDGQRSFAKGDIVGGYENYKKALSYNTPLDRDSRDSFIRMAAQGNILKKIDKEKAREILNYAIEISGANLEYNPNDSLMLLVHSQLLNKASALHKDSPEEFYYYSNSALDAVNKSIEASPGRIPIYFQKAYIYMTRGEEDAAIKVLEYAVSLNEDYYESVCQLAKTQIAGKREEGYENMNKCIDKGGSKALAQPGFIKQMINYYVEREDWKRVLPLYEKLSKLNPGNAKIWSNLAGLYAKLGNTEKAIEAARRTGELNPNMKSSAEEFIRELEK